MHKCDHSDFLEFCIFGYFLKSLFCLLLFLVFFYFFSYPFIQYPSRFSPLLTLSATRVASAPLFPSSCPLSPFLFSSLFLLPPPLLSPSTHMHTMFSNPCKEADGMNPVFFPCSCNSLDMYCGQNNGSPKMSTS